MESAPNSSLKFLDDKFTTQMAAFNARLNESTAAPADLGTLRADFRAFESMMLQALELLRKQYEHLDGRVDDLEAHSRRRVLLLHGVAESEGEDPAALVTRLCTDKLGLDAITVADLTACYRLGRTVRGGGDKKRPLIVTFQSMVTRDGVWSSKTRLKGSGISLSEFLTPRRRALFVEARKAFGISKSWTRNGGVFVQAASGSAVRVVSASQLLELAGAMRVTAPSASNAEADAGGSGGSRQRPARMCNQGKPSKSK